MKPHPKRIDIITVAGEELSVRASRLESVSWSDGIAALVPTDGVVLQVAMSLPSYNALVADWALSAPGRTRGLQFSIRAHARAGRLTGSETWPRNKP